MIQLLNQLVNIVEKAIEDCMQYFHRFRINCECKLNFVRGEDGEKMA